MTTAIPTSMPADHATLPDDLLTYREAAKVLGVCERSVSYMVARGELPCVALGRLRRIDPRDLRAMIDSRRTMAKR